MLILASQKDYIPRSSPFVSGASASDLAQAEASEQRFGLGAGYGGQLMVMISDDDVTMITDGSCICC